LVRGNGWRQFRLSGNNRGKRFSKAPPNEDLQNKFRRAIEEERE
jgi:hypothetical protein